MATTKDTTPDTVEAIQAEMDAAQAAADARFAALQAKQIYISGFRAPLQSKLAKRQLLLDGLARAAKDRTEYQRRADCFNERVTSMFNRDNSGLDFFALVRQNEHEHAAVEAITRLDGWTDAKRVEIAAIEEECRDYAKANPLAADMLGSDFPKA